MGLDYPLISRGETILNVLLKILLCYIWIFSFHNEFSEVYQSCFILFCLSVLTSVSIFTVVWSKLDILLWNPVDLLLQKSSCQEKTARTAPSTAFPATGVSTPTHPHTHPWQPPSARAWLPRPRLSLCQVCQRRTPLQTELSRESRTPLRSGPSPGACMKVGVSTLFLVAVGWGLHGAAGSMETLAVFKWYCTFWIMVWDKKLV